MFRHFMVPVDLAEKDTLQIAGRVAADLARHYGARMTLVSVSGGLQAKVSHSSKEYGRQLAVHSDEIARINGIEAGSINYDVPDPSVGADHKLIQAIAELNVDLAVMESHQPGWMEYFVNRMADG